MDKLAKVDGPLWLTYGLTSCLKEMMAFMKANDTQWFKKMQAYMLTFSVSFLFSIQLALTSVLEQQKAVCIDFLSKILHKNKYAVNILVHIFKKALFVQSGTNFDVLKA